MTALRQQLLANQVRIAGLVFNDQHHRRAGPGGGVHVETSALCPGKRTSEIQ